MNLFKNFRLSTKILFVIVFLSLSFISLVGLYIVPVLTNTLEGSAEVKLKNLTETAYKIVEYYYNAAQKGQYTEAEAKSSLRLRSVRSGMTVMNISGSMTMRRSSSCIR